VHDGKENGDSEYYEDEPAIVHPVGMMLYQRARCKYSSQIRLGPRCIIAAQTRAVFQKPMML
jgi:hypothetical protein